MRAGTSITIFFLLVACSGKVTSTSSDGGPGTTNNNQDNPPSGPQGSLVAACPTSKPTLGTSCSPLGQLCEYGDDVSSQCNTIAHCSPEGAWESVSGDACTTTIPACDSDVASGMACVGATQQCQIGAGLCTCFDESTGPGRADGGPDSFGWSCASPAPGCPAWPRRPRIGSACSKPDLQCDYAPCGQSGFAFACSADGYWTDSFSTPCSGG